MTRKPAATSATRDQPATTGAHTTLCTDHSLWWVVLIAQSLALVLALLTANDQFWPALAVASAFCLWVGLSGLWALCQLQRLGLSGRQRSHWLIYWCVLSGLAIGGLMIGQSTTRWVFPETSLQDPAHTARLILAILIFSGLLLRYWYLQDALSWRQQARVMAELDALQARLNPHFLFNALNSVAALIRQDPARAEAAVEHLSDLMRASLKSHKMLIPLREELELTRAYLWLEQARFGDRLQIQWDIDESLLNQLLPMLSLQPLVENAVKHGIAPSPRGGTVEITISAAVKVWMLRVRNPLPTKPGRAGNQFALRTLEARGLALMGDQFALSTRRHQDHFIAQMTLHLETERTVQSGAST